MKFLYGLLLGFMLLPVMGLADSPTFTNTPIPTNTFTDTLTPSPTISATITKTSTKTKTPTATPSITKTKTYTWTETRTATPTATPTPSPSITPTFAPGSYQVTDAVLFAVTTPIPANFDLTLTFVPSSPVSIAVFNVSTGQWIGNPAVPLVQPGQLNAYTATNVPMGMAYATVGPNTIRLRITTQRFQGGMTYKAYLTYYTHVP